MREEQDRPATKVELLANEEAPCPLCSRPLGLVGVDRHHLVPKSRKGKVQWFIHKICHRKIHATFTDKELQTQYFTWEALLQHPMISEFVAWVQKKDPGFYIGSKEAKRRR